MDVTIAKLERGCEGSGVGASESGDTRENFGSCGGRLFVKGDEGMAKQGENTGSRFSGGRAQFVFFMAIEEKMLAELEE